MRVVNLKSGYLWGHLWLGEIPECVHSFSNKDNITTYPVTRIIESRTEKVVSSVENARTAALQLVWVTGGRGYWAFLGATLQPHTNSSCMVRVGVSADDSGLTPALAEAVNAQAIKSITERNLPLSGTLSFEHAINHPIDLTQNYLGWLQIAWFNFLILAPIHLLMK